MNFIINIKITRGKELSPIYFHIDLRNSKNHFEHLNFFKQFPIKVLKRISKLIE